MNPFLVLEHVNLFCGTDPGGDDVSNHLILSELQLPKFSEQYIDHRPGGAAMAIEIDVIFQHLEAHFQLIGVQPQVMKLLRPYAANQTWFTALGFVRDPFDGTYTQAKAQMQGRLGSIEPENWQRGRPFHIGYSIREIMQYKLEVAGFGSIVDWDFMTNKMYVG